MSLETLPPGVTTERPSRNLMYGPLLLFFIFHLYAVVHIETHIPYIVHTHCFFLFFFWALTPTSTLFFNPNSSPESKSNKIQSRRWYKITLFFSFTLTLYLVKHTFMCLCLWPIWGHGPPVEDHRFRDLMCYHNKPSISKKTHKYEEKNTQLHNHYNGANIYFFFF